MFNAFKTFFAAAALLLFAMPAHAAPEIGKPAPAFTLTDTHGKTHNLSDFTGKTVVLEWTNHECPFVRKHYDTQNMQDLQAKAAEDGVVWLTVVSSAEGKEGFQTPEEANALIEKEGSKEAARLIDADGTAGTAYEAKTTPHMFIVDKEGTLVYMGAIDDNPSADKETAKTAKNYVTAALAEIKEGKPVTVSATKPYGCGVKYGSGT